MSGHLREKMTSSLTIVPLISDSRLVITTYYIIVPALYCHEQWLEDEFLGYLDEWKKYVNSDKSLSSADKARMMLSRETLEGITITG